MVNSYAATSDVVLVILERNVDFPTEGNPMSATRASLECEAAIIGQSEALEMNRIVTTLLGEDVQTSALLDIKTFTSLATFCSRFQQLLTVSGKLSFQETQMTSRFEIASNRRRRLR